MYGAITAPDHMYLLHVTLIRGGAVLLKISAGIPHDAAGSVDQLSVTEVSVKSGLTSASRLP